MNTLLQKSGNLLRVISHVVSQFLFFHHATAPKRVTKKLPASDKGRGKPAPDCLKRGFQGVYHLLVNPATDERCLSTLSKSEAEELLDWLNANNDLILEVSFQEETGYLVRWTVE